MTPPLKSAILKEIDTIEFYEGTRELMVEGHAVEIKIDYIETYFKSGNYFGPAEYDGYYSVKVLSVWSESEEIEIGDINNELK